MERLEAKTVNGHTYYYYSCWARVNGKPKRLWQKYLGKLKDIAEAVLGGGKAPLCADVFEWGLPEALWQLCSQSEIASCVDRQCSHRPTRALSTGDYLAIAALNRAIRPQSKRSLWQWFSQTTLQRRFPRASQKRLSAQRFWDHMDRIQEADIPVIWHDLLRRLLQREAFDLSSICYDGTNYYSFIDTFNSRCEMPRHGKNKQGRNNLRQVSYALFCCADGQLPLYFDVYEGNRNDAKEFPKVLAKFHEFLRKLGQAQAPATTLIFDKGNNSAENFALLDQMELHFVGSVKLDEHKELMHVPNDDPRFTPFDRLPGTKAFRVKKKVYGRERTVVVSYNQNLFNAQWQTLQNDIAKASQKLSALQKRLTDRVAGTIQGGKTPTVVSIQKQSQAAVRRQHLKKVLDIEVTLGSDGVPILQYGVNASALQTLSNTHLGKTLLLSNRGEWSDEQIITAYRSQYLIEEVFKESKDRGMGNWWPMHHWTDSKIRVHGLYCTIAQLLRALLMRRVRQGGLKLSMKRLLVELSGIREVINIYPSKGGKKERQQTVLSRPSKVQDRLISILGLADPGKEKS
jgi:transposase